MPILGAIDGGQRATGTARPRHRQNAPKADASTAENKRTASAATAGAQMLAAHEVRGGRGGSSGTSQASGGAELASTQRPGLGRRRNAARRPPSPSAESEPVLDPKAAGLHGAAQGGRDGAKRTTGSSKADDQRERPLGRRMVAEAKDQLGKPYVFGTAGPSSFDCSGLTLFAAKSVGIELPHKASMQATMGRAISRDHLKPGDLVYFKGPGESEVSHIGMYVGNGQFIHAPGTGDVVKISDLDSGWAADYYVGARRLSEADVTPTPAERREQAAEARVEKRTRLALARRNEALGH